MPNITEIKCKQACTKVNDKGGLPSWNLNLYRGCTHRCIYCFAIYSHDYLDSQGNYYDDLYVKTNIVSQLEKQLSSPSWKGEEIGISGVSDCYQPLEAKYKLMPDILKVLIRYKNPCSISTKSDLILRDYDLIDELSSVTKVHINASISSVDNEIRKKIEPGAKNAEKKFAMLKEFSKTKATTGMLQMPIIPYITDSRENIEQLYANAADSKVGYIVPGILYLKGKTRGIFFDSIKREFPELLQPLQHLYRNGKADKVYKDSLYKMVHQLRKKYHLTNYTPSPPPQKTEMEVIKKVAAGYKQLSLFDAPTTTPQTFQASPIPSREQLAANQTSGQKPQATAELDLASFVEIEMGSTKPASPSPTPVALPTDRPIDKVADEKRTLFYSMRQIAKDTTAYADHSKIFYEQALFMRDFEDNFTNSIPFSSYFPYYQRMGYDQLRTYFTWRTKVRKGIISPTSTSYAFLYIYELLNQIGVMNPEDGLDKLMIFWQTFRTSTDALDQYVLQWLKDYHIYYPLPHSFREFAMKQQLIAHYPTVFGYDSGKEDSFELFADISKYNIKKSIFYKDENKDLINDSFYFVLTRFRGHFQSQGQCFEDLIFYPLSKVVTWTPFKRALFYPAKNQSEREVSLTQKEVYNYKGNRWQYKSVMLADHGRLLVGYIMKEMECSLRKVVKFKYKLTANVNVCDKNTLAKFEQLGISLPEFIQACVEEFYAESTRKIISVDAGNLQQIRKDALQTQEKLIVPEEDESAIRMPEKPVSQAIVATPLASDSWSELKAALTDIEIEAVRLLLDGRSIKEFALQKMIMLEVLIEGINDKGMDFIGDALLELDDVVIIYDEYREKLMEMVS